MRIRTIDAAFDEIKQADPNSAISKHFIRQLIINGDVPSRKSGRKYVFDMDDLEKYFKHQQIEEQ